MLDEKIPSIALAYLMLKTAILVLNPDGKSKLAMRLDEKRPVRPTI
jgi:hypothetical protein